MAKQIKKIIPDTVEMPVEVLEQNAGQLEGVPANPRTIKKEKFDALKQSLKDDPEMLGYRPLMVYPHGEKYIIIGGNMRYAAAKALGFSTIPCIVLPENTTEEKLRAYAIKDNNGYGEWDWDMLANEWDEDLLKEWGLDLPEILDEETKEEPETNEDDFDEEKDSIKVLCKRGDIWKLGEHRLMCGDSIQLTEVQRLMGGGWQSGLVTDRPAV